MKHRWFRFDYKKNKHHSMNYHSHREFEIFYFHEGKAKIIIQHRIFDLQPGDIVLLNGLTPHHTCTMPPHPYVRTTVEFLPEFIALILKSMKSIELFDIFSVLNNSIIRMKDQADLVYFQDCIARLNHLISRRDNNQLNHSLVEGQVKNTIIDLLFEINHLARTPLAEIILNKSEKDTLMEKMIAWITKNHMEQLTLDHLSKEFHISKRHITQLFRDILGITVMEYVMRCRIDHAKILLEIEPNKQISDIALDVGFKNSAHFSRYFSEKTGVPPSQFRRERISPQYNN
ncbi:AraC family transcriptional regulator [Bacillus sp. J14TS2]|uniref:helix-turn-helix transcriptional regulator n=1 Tax=Bacillus sp. J14TS2 TaxID=2807188 RepID=UPI001B29A4AE|nr:AraC family transcriptional regulator [Bacillus sp. J14TS2]GIN70765.1 AraC family transcriptional regulator [Bacillus sp. J14TS2]